MNKDYNHIPLSLFIYQIWNPLNTSINEANESRKELHGIFPYYRFPFTYMNTIWYYILNSLQILPGSFSRIMSYFWLWNLKLKHWFIKEDVFGKIPNCTVQVWTDKYGWKVESDGMVSLTSQVVYFKEYVQCSWVTIYGKHFVPIASTRCN